MRHPQLLLLAGICLLGVVTSIVALVEVRRARKLRDRVLAVRGGPVAPGRAALPSIRVAEARRAGWQTRLFQLIRFVPDLPQAHVIPWPVVALIAAAGGLVSGTRAATWADPLLAPLFGCCSCVMIARGLFGWQIRRYQDAIFIQIPDALGLMVRAIRAGLPLAEALRGIGREGPSPLREEFARVVGDMAIGRPVDVAIMRLHERTGLTEFSFLAVTLGLQSQTGGSLSETLDTLAEMVRKRVAMGKRVKALSAEAKVQAGLLVVLPFVAGAAMSMFQPYYVDTFLHDPTGQQLGLAGLGLMGFGLVVIRRLIRQARSD
ncbi:type II secretion system F family protein [Roseomonas sp. CCTCC AB2023176]|uniref:type II secretion system F family protein n=1 Tax=Roseomonas sp. CCTCC AB2023176 TaxID=3342640 RepID=UPI0035DC8415